VVGWDGADWELLDPMLEQGRLPNLRSLIERGASAKLFSLKPMISPLIWTSVATGCQPDVHGVLDFVRPDPGGGQPLPVTSSDRRVPALWNIFSAAGVTVGSVAWWATWPAEAVDGVMVSDRVAYQLGAVGGEPEKGLVYPPQAWSWLAAERTSEEEVGFDAISRFVHLSREEYEAAIAAGGGYEDPIIHLRRLLASTRSYHRMTLAVWRRVQPEVMLTYCEGTDTIAHLFAPFAPPRRRFIDEADFVRYGDAVGSYYELADELLGELLAEVGPSANVMLCSDHGFAWGTDRPREASGVNTPTAAWWHRDPGVLVVAGPDFRAVDGRREAQILDLPPTLLALAGLPVGQRMVGSVLDWTLDEGVMSEVREAVDYVQLLSWDENRPAAITDQDGGAVVERLRALGYLAGSETAPAPTEPPAESARSLLNLGTVLLEQGRLEEALAAYERALELDPEMPGAWLGPAHRESASVGMAIALVELQRSDEALLLLEAATAHLPDSFILWKMRGEIALGQGRHEPARRAYARALELEEDTDAYNRLAALVLQLDGDAAEAAELWRRSLELDPDQPRVRDALRALGDEVP
jgi:Tfp pilus assembly protein PilF